MDEIEVKSIRSTSKRSALGDDIVLSANQSHRLLFRPEIIDNPKNPEACLEGQFIRQRKGKNDDWENTESFKAFNLTAGTEVNLRISTEELLNLLTGLDHYKEYFKEKGIPWGRAQFVVTTGDTLEALQELSKVTSIDSIKELLPRLRNGELARVSNVVGYMQLVDTVQEIREGLNENHNEEWWQQKFLEAPWVLGQLFTQPVVLLDGKAYVGGKNIGNTGGKVADYLFQNELTGNVAIIEIKTPQTKLLQKNVYREGVFGLSEEMSGAVGQSLTYCETLTQDYATMAKNSEKDFIVIRPRCVIIAGLTSELDSKFKVRSFELQRCAHKDLELVTFDELAHRCEALLRLMQLTTSSEQDAFAPDEPDFDYREFGPMLEHESDYEPDGYEQKPPEDW